jgi:hypothetical protein
MNFDAVVKLLIRVVIDAATTTTTKEKRTSNDIVRLSIVRCSSTGTPSSFSFSIYFIYFKTKVSIEHDDIRALS